MKTTSLIIVALVAIAAFTGCGTKPVHKEHTPIVRTAPQHSPDYLYVVQLDGSVVKYQWPLTNSVPGL